MTSPVSLSGTLAVAPGRRGLAAAGVLLAAAIAGPITGWLHAAMIAIERLGEGGFAWYSREFVWMAPIAYTLIFVVAALPLAIVALVRPAFVRPAVVAGWMAVLLAFGLLLPWPQVGRLPSLILALGVGVQVGRWVGRSAPWWQRNAKRLAGLEMALIAVIAVLQPVVRAAL